MNAHVQRAIYSVFGEKIMAKILLVEDDADFALAVTEILAENGHHVTHFDDGRQALDELGQNKYDLIVLDWNLPNLSGHAVLETYRVYGGLTPVIMMTGMGSIDHKVQGLDAGADDYLCKPFDLHELVIRVRSILRRWGEVYA
jgi:two-component system OmpR family response regulator